MSHIFFQAKQTEELEMLAEKVTDLLETAASAADLCTARQGLLEGIEEIRASLDVTLTGCHNTGSGHSIHLKTKFVAVLCGIYFMILFFIFFA